MFCWKIVSIGLSVLALCAAQEASYKRYARTRVYTAKVQDAFQLAEVNVLLSEMRLELLDAVKNGGSLEVVVAPEQQPAFEKALRKLGIQFQITIRDLMKILDQRRSKHPILEMEWTQYHHVKHIFKWLRAQAKQHSAIATLLTLGRTYEGRPIKAMKISKPGRADKKAIFVECQNHAIEWISSAGCTCFLNNLLNSGDPKVQELTVNYDWIMVPVLNPDGLAYTHDVTPLWRKNRRPNGGFGSIGTECIGIDMNRNFDFHWKEAGFNTDIPCSNFYAGSAPESEQEVRALREFIDSQPEGYIRMYLAVHSFGNKITLPFGHTTDVFPKNYQQMVNISRGFAEAARVKYGTNFTYGTSGEILYPVSGTTKDWAHGAKHIPYSCTIELRDEGPYGFFLPPDQILPVCAELTDGLVGMVKAAEDEKLYD